MPLASLFAGAAQRDALVEGHVVADLGGFADDHAHAVIDEEAPADLGAGMDLDSGDPSRDLRQASRREAQPCIHSQ